MKHEAIVRSFQTSSIASGEEDRSMQELFVPKQFSGQMKLQLGVIFTETDKQSQKSSRSL